jgi:hypothetical protein
MEREIMPEHKAGIEDIAVRLARMARNFGVDGGLAWDDARAACKRAVELLTEWEKTQPHPHSGS